MPRIEFELVVLHDDGSAALRVVEQPAVVRAQIHPPLVRAHARHDDVVLREIAPGEIVLIDERHLRAELLDRRRHLIADAVDIPDGEPRRDRDVHDLDRRLGRLDDLPALNVRVLDLLIPVVEPRAARGPWGRCCHDRAHRVVAGLHRGRRRHHEPRGERLVLVRERDRHAGRRGAPADGQLERDADLARALGAVRHRDVDLARDGRTSGRRRHDGERRRDADRVRRHDV